MESLYNKIYNAVNEGIQKALLIDPAQNDVSINYSYHKINNKTDIKFLFKSYMEDENYEAIYDLTKKHGEDEFLHAYKFEGDDFETEFKLFVTKYIQKYSDANLNWIDTSNITNMRYLFQGEDFTGDISKWDVSHVTDFSSMFSLSDFNGDISNWQFMQNIPAGQLLISMESMFESSKFNQNISNWDVSNVTNMESMFENSEFNQDISKWGDKLINCQKFKRMFANSKFHKDISNWDIHETIEINGTQRIVQITEMFDMSQIYFSNQPLFPIEYMPKLYIMSRLYNL